MPMKDVPPFAILETLHEGRETLLLRGVRTADHLPVILKVLDPRRSHPRGLERLKREYEILGRLDAQAIVKPIALDTHEGMPALVMEDFGGQSLDHFLGAPLPTERFLDLAVRITAAVAELHQRDIIHKDLKPQNILLNAATGQVKLADFGCASSLPREHKASKSPRLVEGSLPYLSPEQTGRMNRSIDSRADLYALGVTFYEMLTGRLPFEAHDPLEWVHCHVARAPPSPSTFVSELPEILSAIVLKLLAKMAEDRYQTARGLLNDLAQCRGQWRAEGRLEPFPLAEHDIPDRLQIPQKLYGREGEIAALLSAPERVLDTGSPELVLVSGYSGIGKSALVNELQKPIVRERGFFIAGKFDQYKRGIPYSTIVQAFRDLVLEILTESEERIAAWRQRLLGALGINGQLIVDVIPQVELAIGPQPPVAELPPAEAQNRFRIVFRHFIGVFARKEHPLALFLDDLQWADSASLGLLQDLLTHGKTCHLLVIGACRDNEVSPSHPLMLMLDKVRKEGVRVSDIVLGPLSREHLAMFVSDALHCPREGVRPLADLVHEKTAGNPFFAIQFLTALHEERLIEFDGRAGIWQWDVAKIREKGFTDNVVDLMIGKLVRLPASTQEALKHLACLGNTAEAAILTMARGGSVEDTHASLWEAVRAGFVLRLDDVYKFLHDRVQEAAYSLIPEEQRAEVHLRIGRLLLAKLPEEVIAERVFDVANQLNHGVALITDPREKETLCRLDFQAGRRAKASIAYASAQSYLAQATALLAADAWRTQYEETFALYMERSECEYLVGNFQRADELFDLIFQNARSNPDRARVYRLRIRLYQVSGRYADGVTVAQEALRLFCVTLPASDEEIKAAVEAENRGISASLRGLRIADLLDAPVVSDPDGRAIIGVLVDSIPCAYNARPEMFALGVVKALSFSLRYGNAEETCFAYCAYGIMLASVFGDIPSAYEFSEMSLRLNEKLNDAKLKGRLLFMHGGHIHSWRRPIATSVPIMEQAFLACLEVGDLVFAGLVTVLTVWLVLETGSPLDEVLRVAQKYLAFARESHNDTVFHTIQLERQFVASLQGPTLEPANLDDRACDEAESLAVITGATFGCGIAFYHVMKHVAAFNDGRYREALDAAARAATMLGAVMAQPIEATHHFYHALTLTALYPQAPAAQQREFARTLERGLQKLKLWADNCPENYLNRYALVSAEVARIEGRELDAERLYEEATRSARENGFVHIEALAYELASRFYRARGFALFADTCLREARACYARWGADGKVRQIDQQHPRLLESRSLAPTTTFGVRSEQFDLLSVTKASQTISGEITFDKLLRTLLTVVLEQGGAQRGCLILCRDGCSSIEAEASLEGSGVATKLLESQPLSSSLVPVSIVNYAMRTKERVILEDAAEAAKYASEPYIARVKPRSLLCLPILRQTEVVGLLYLENNLLAGAFTPDRLVALSLLATQAAISLEKAQLLGKEQAARAAAEAARAAAEVARAAAEAAERRATFIAEAGALLSESLDYKETLARLARLSVRSISDWCVIDIVEGGEIRRICGAHKDPAKEPLLEQLQRWYPPRTNSPHPASKVLQTGEPILIPDLTEEVIGKFVVNEEHRKLSRELGAQSSIVVPLAAHGQTLGVLSVVSATPERRYGRADLALVEDVARRAAVAIDNARLYRKTQEAVRVRDEFLTVASHELNTPVTSLRLTLQSMDRAIRSGRSGDTQVMSKLVERALRQGTRLARLNKALVDVSQLHGGRLPLEREDVDLATLLRNVLDQLKPELSQARCSVHIQYDHHVVGRWDPDRIEQILTNLLSNAIKFGAGKPIEIFYGEEQGIARIVVKDHGIGIDPARQERIFERFERAASENYGGLGLGLYISRRIAEAHGGALRVQSEPGVGSSFTLELPCAGHLSTAC
ncbi:sensor histidine kinase [Polyangium jinanense]|uniref:histidine kinase n=1 Tax=Polyangium jinanense TaxID=2829994 RepID=A0A9X3XGN1_9BACT|nr:AAA family ATPase [Polyangium jinanense]MDC3961352.1 AAA family ATPase [Polyangium jinanense]MDC3987731.1 AAA family ATPase [Polyangium jinanense]